jgi:transposase
MKQTQETLRKEDSTKQKTLYIAFELSNTEWKLAFSDGSKIRYVSIDARKLYQVERGIERARKHFGLSEGIQIVSCYEAGRDGFWLHRYLVGRGIENLVVDSSSIEVNRRRRRVKTDRLDAGKLLGMLQRYVGGEQRAWRVVRVPTEQVEDERNIGRELDVLMAERTRHSNRIKGLLVQQGIVIKNVISKKFLHRLEAACRWDGQKVAGDFKARIVREHERLRMVYEQMRRLKKERAARVQRQDTRSMQQVVQLQKLRGIGPESSWDLVMEFFGWRQFQNRRQVAALAGLTPTPYDSGGSVREQGISKEGNRRIRALSIESAWCWLRFQPESHLSQWFEQRFATGGKRMRRIGIVALARRLLIELWRYLNTGVLPPGARLSRHAI